MSDGKLATPPTKGRPVLRLWQLALLVAVCAVVMALAIRAPVLLFICIWLISSYLAANAWERQLLQQNRTDPTSIPRVQRVVERIGWFVLFLLFFFLVGMSIIVSLASYFQYYW